MAEPDSVYEARQDGLIITAVVMTVIAGTFVLMRSTSRFIVIRNSGVDDYFALGSMILTICYVVMLFILRENHIGFPMTKLTPDDMVGFIKTTLAIQVLYYVNVFCIKTSILSTYLRFAVTRTFRYLCIGTIILHAIFFFICFVVTLSQCRPLRKMWDFTNSVQGSCINTTAFFYSTSTFNILTDFFILLLPYRTLRAIQRPSREKIALFLIFGAGAFACVASIVRLYSIRIYTESPDPIRDGIPVNLWSIIELTVALSCASIPALKPLFSRHQRAATRAARSKGSSSKGPYSGSSGTGATTGSRSGMGMGYTPQTSRFLSPHSNMYDPERMFSPTVRPGHYAGHFRLDSDATSDQHEARDEIHAALGFHPPITCPRPPVGDRDNTESSGFSLGLPLQTPPPQRTGSAQSVGRVEQQQQKMGGGVVIPPPHQQHQRELPSRNASQTSVDSVHRPPIPRRRSSQSQRSVRIEIFPRPPTSRNPSQTSLERPAMASRNPSQRSLPLPSAMRPPAPAKKASQGSFYLE
ncbi:hypothetical protein QBC34DRAFT_438567 [Podospora aff. communis PSN243]|uniref:Rhodopsin domain-containing protein n=1 Tax=Podospora aff. communis PSN243 TaxID=3040156 RepID=A0AAV9GLP2_9PEZI|nr:hypothetical protein QBC34DRAFT_438567 [Podospora aff. communis PSN243]